MKIKNITQYRKFLILPILLALIALAARCTSPTTPSAQSCTSGKSFSASDTFYMAKIEPSGIVYHQDRQSLFVIGDQGDIVEMSLDGTVLRSVDLGNIDFEGLTYNPATGLLYAVEENKSRIHELDPRYLGRRRVFSIQWSQNGSELLNPKKEHLEGITFVADSTQADGGYFYVANRSKKPDDKKSPSALYKLELPLGDYDSKEPKAQVLNEIRLDIAGLSGLFFSQDQHGFYVVSDDNNKLYSLAMDGGVIDCFSLPGEKQEGIVFADNLFAYVADDSRNSVFRLQK